MLGSFDILFVFKKSSNSFLNLFILSVPFPETEYELRSSLTTGIGTFSAARSPAKICLTTVGSTTPFIELDISELQDAGASSEGGLNGTYTINFDFDYSGGGSGNTGNVDTGP